MSSNDVATSGSIQTHGRVVGPVVGPTSVGLSPAAWLTEVGPTGPTGPTISQANDVGLTVINYNTAA